MAGFLLAQKTQQSQMFTPAGKRIPVTVLKSDSCYLIDVKQPEVQGYFAVKLGIGSSKNIKNPVKGELKKAGIESPLHFLQEIRLEYQNHEIKAIEENGKKGIALGDAKVFVGEKVNPTLFFKVGDSVDVAGTSKGKGFQGVVRRHGFAGGPKTHGQSDRERAPGSIGQTTTPGRVYKGKRMAGRMGGDRVHVKNLEVVTVSETGLTIKGLVPGHLTSVVTVRAHKA